MLEFQGETRNLLRADSNIGIPFPRKQGNLPSSRLEEGENGALLELWRETRCSSRVGTGISGTFLSCIRVSSTLSHFKSSVSRHCSGKGPHLALRGESCGCSQVVAGSNPGDSNPGEAIPGDSPHSAASVVSFPGDFSGHLAHILYTRSCTHELQPGWATNTDMAWGKGSH